MCLPRTKMPKNSCRCSLTPKRWSSTPLSLRGATHVATHMWCVSYTSQIPSKEQNVERGQREQLYSGEIWKHGLNLRVKRMSWWEVMLITCDPPHPRPVWSDKKATSSNQWILLKTVKVIRNEESEKLSPSCRGQRDKITAHSGMSWMAGENRKWTLGGN